MTLTIAIALIGAPARSQSVVAIKVAPTLADQVNAVLARLADPVAAPVTQNAAGKWVRPDCAGAPEVQPPAASSETLYLPPCVKVRRDVQTLVRKGETWKALIGRLGLLPSSKPLISFASVTDKTASKPDPSRSRPPEGKIATVDQVGIWTRVTLQKSGVITTLDAFRKALSMQFGCNDNVSDCLTGKGISIMAADAPPDPKPPGVAVIPASHDFDFRIIGLAGSHAGNLVASLSEPGLGSPQSFDVVAEAAAAPMPTPTPKPTPASPPLPAIAAGPSVAPDQWPYDRALLALELQDAVAHDSSILPTRIGVMDVGLATALGGPLPAKVFPVVDGQLDPGSGVSRIRDNTTDVAICPALDDVGLKQLAGHNDESVSHGVVVSAIAAGLELRSLAGAERVLPQVSFYRLFNETCPPARVSIRDNGAIGNALEYLGIDSKIINASLLDTGFSHDVGLLVDNLTTGAGTIVVAAAGNDGYLVDHDRSIACPVCLRVAGSLTPGGPVAQARTIIVGAAGPDLQRETYSNYGNAVQIFAPGAPNGAVDLLNQDASKLSPATSYAAPYVARALAMIISLGHFDQHVDWAVHRLMLSTWAYPGDDGPAPLFGSTQVSVVDLVKAAAVRHYAIEAVVRDADKVLRLRTYVGDISGGLHSVTSMICPGEKIEEKASQAFLFDRVGDGPRNVYKIDQRPSNVVPPLVFQNVRGTCTSVGSVTLHDLSGHDISIDSSSITMILAPIRPGG